MRRFAPALALTLCALLPAASAGNAAPASASFPVTVTHALGQTTVPARPTRVVALGPHALDLLLSLGVQPVGYGEAAQLGVKEFGSPIRQIKYLGSRVTSAPLYVGDRFKPNLELLASLKPDLIVGEDFASAAYPALNRVAPTLLFTGTHSGDWQKSLPVLARALGREDRAAAVLARSRAVTDEARAALTPWQGQRALVVWNSGGANRDLYTVLGPKDWTGGLLQDLGFRLVLPGSPDPTLAEGYRALSVEALGALDPDVVFVVASGTNTPARAASDWKASALAQRLRASRAGRVYFMPIQLVGRIRGPIATELTTREIRRQLGAR
ncbi:ABC transporter substrate-binding protein [Deinococcus gobiensis]|uniref:ABC transporter substrate-binding protein n=1 Tax=Deinococcus gobiensis TaxID=502394 RepID=UPI0003147FCD|nr:iron-siderophore ABC transporter substrate-binding protein [Deinococcus gobiensis]